MTDEVAPPIRRASNWLSVAAVVVWLVSLTQPTFIIEHGTGKPDAWFGLGVLLTGWISLLGNAGWLANPLFWLALAMHWASKRQAALILALLALLAACDTFRIREFGGGGRNDVVAYGIGVTLWFVALALAVVATAAGAAASGSTRARLVLGRSLLVGGIAAIALSLSWYGYRWFDDRRSVSTTDWSYLQGGGIKRGAVCTEKVAAPLAKLDMSGPLEVLVQGNHTHPFNSLPQLLRWGIPAIRKDGFDFALSDPRDPNSAYATRASGEPAARLTVTGVTTRDGATSTDTLTATLVSADGQRTAFRQVWKRDSSAARYCPDFSYYEKDASLPPQSLVTAALGIPASAAVPSRGDGNALGGPFAKATARILSVRADASINAAAENAGCPAGTGFFANDKLVHTYGINGQAFRTGDRHYFLSNNQPLSAACADGSAYLYYIWLDQNRRSFVLYLQPRPLHGFRGDRTLVIRFDYERPEPFRHPSVVRLRSIRQTGGEMHLELADVQQGAIIRASFAVP